MLDGTRCCIVLPSDLESRIRRRKYKKSVQGDPEGLGLGLVDLIWGVPPAGGPLLQLLTAQAGWWNIPNLSQPNPGPRPSGSPCIFSPPLVGGVRLQASSRDTRQNEKEMVSRMDIFMVTLDYDTCLCSFSP